jgi:hypothetical protein
MTQAPVENALTNVRAEWVPSDLSGEFPGPPTDPSWNRFSDHIAAWPGWSGDASVEGQNVAGSGWTEDHFRGPEEHDLTVSYWLQRFFIDNSSDPNDPIGELLTLDYQSHHPVHELLFRREVADGGVDDAGFREFIYGSGCYPSSGAAPGDPSASEPIIAEAGYAAQKVRQYIIHQPSDSTQITVVSTNDNDSMDITIESEDAGTTETITLNGTTEVSGSTSFSDIDAFWLSAEPQGDISIKDDADNNLLEDPIQGSENDGVEGDRGVPPLGSGSHSSAIGTDPEDYLFLGTSSTFGGGALAESASADRVHALDLSIDVDITREPLQGTRRQSIDPGTATVEVDADVAGPYESAKQNVRYFRGTEGDLVYTYPDGTVTVKNSQLTDTDDVDRSAGDSNQLYGVTFAGHGDPAVTASHS